MTEFAEQVLPAGPRPNLGAVFDLLNKAQQCKTSAELYFLLANLTKQLVVYQQAILYREGRGFVAVSGLSEIDVNAPMLIWLRGFLRAVHEQKISGQINVGTLSVALSDGYAEWFSGGMAAIPFMIEDSHNYGYLLLVRDESFVPEELAAIDFLVKNWVLSLRVLEEIRGGEGLSLLSRLAAGIQDSLSTFFASGYRRLFQISFYWGKLATLVRKFRTEKTFRWKAYAALLVLLPVRLTIISPGEIIASQPMLIRAPIDGVLERFYVEPNSLVKQGQSLFSYDNSALLAKAEGARQAFLSAEAEYRQTSILALSDPKQKVNLAILQAKANEKRAEHQFLSGQVQRSVLVAPFDGWAIFDDPADQVGKPISVGEKIMMLADPKDVEIQAWISLGDMIDISRGAQVKIYPNPNPFNSVSGHVKYVTYEPIQLPDGQYAYRLRAAISHGEPLPRLGLKGTVKVSGNYVPIIYWVLRKPIAQIRQLVGY